MEVKRIVVGVDFTRASVEALKCGWAIAGSAHMDLVHVIGPEQLPRVSHVDPDILDRMVKAIEADAAPILDEFVHELQASGASVSSQLLWGSPGEELVKAAEHANLLVVGAHSRGLIDRLTLGSVAEEVAQHSKTPVLVVRERGQGALKITRVLVGLDLWHPNDGAIGRASLVADRVRAKLEAVHVVPWPVFPAPSAARHRPADVEARLREEATTMVRDAFRSTGKEVSAIHIAFGSPADEIRKLANEDDVIVCGTHGRGPLARLVYGEVAIKLLRTAPCPVLVYRQNAPDTTRITRPPPTG